MHVLCPFTAIDLLLFSHLTSSFVNTMISPMEISLLFVGLLVLVALSTILACLFALAKRLSSLEATVQAVSADLASSGASITDNLTAVKWGVLRVADQIKRHQTDCKTHTLAALVKLLEALVREHVTSRELIRNAQAQSWLAISQVVDRAARRIAGQSGNSSSVEVQTDVELGLVPGEDAPVAMDVELGLVPSEDAPVPSADSVVLQME